VRPLQPHTVHGVAAGGMLLRHGDPPSGCSGRGAPRLRDCGDPVAGSIRYSVLYIVLYTVLYIVLYMLYSMLYSICCTLYAVLYMLYSILYSICCTLYAVLYAILYATLYAVLYATLYMLYAMLYSCRSPPPSTRLFATRVSATSRRVCSARTLHRPDAVSLFSLASTRTAILSARRLLPLEH
jgi:hypothetical protein